MAENDREKHIAKVIRREAHERIALICLRVLSDRKLARPPTHRHLANRKLQAAGFLGYAVTQFSEHVYGASSESDKLLAELDRFLRSSSILTWIELLSRRGSLQGLIRVAKNLGAYLDRRAKCASPLNGMAQVKMVEGWSVTLSRLVIHVWQSIVVISDQRPLPHSSSLSHYYRHSPEFWQSTRRFVLGRSQ